MRYTSSMARFPIGPSSYGDLKRVMQYVNSLRIAMQFLSLKIDFDRLPSSRATGARLTPNEGMRSRARQSWFWAMRFVLAIVVAPPFTSRHDEVTRGNAIDVGVTMPDGSNRALTPAEFAWMHAECAKRGFIWTGVNFGEPWHIEGALVVEQKPPYPWATVEAAYGPIEDAHTDPEPEAPEPVIYEESDMEQRIHSDSGSYYVICETTMTGPMSQTRAGLYNRAGNHPKPFAEVTSREATQLIEDMRDRRDSLGGRVSSLTRKQIDAALKKERDTTSKTKIGA